VLAAIIGGRPASFQDVRGEWIGFSDDGYYLYLLDFFDQSVRCSWDFLLEHSQPILTGPVKLESGRFVFELEVQVPHDIRTVEVRLRNGMLTGTIAGPGWTRPLNLYPNEPSPQPSLTPPTETCRPINQCFQVTSLNRAKS
jgi:hypothetical protein